VNINRRQSILELGAGWGDVSVELAERSPGDIIAIDVSVTALRAITNAKIRRVLADAHHLPLSGRSIDLVVTQCACLWFANPSAVVREIDRVLTDDGGVALVEPDFGGLIEHPDSVAVRDIWISALQRAGADPFVGRKIPELLMLRGFQVDTLLLDRAVAPSSTRFELLQELPLTSDEQRVVGDAIKASQNAAYEFAHLPYILVAARRS
jgi:SAM-dependent methyltransferase